MKKELSECDIQNIAKEIIVKKQEQLDSAYKEVSKALLTTDDIELKTEYRNVAECFAGTKLDFMSSILGMPYCHEWIKIHEIKRVSLERQGRKEYCGIIKNKEQELKEQQLQTMLNVNKNNTGGFLPSK